jgi:L-lactate dehydrogenase complex protein LldF
MSDSGRFSGAQKLVKIGAKPLESLGLPGWSASRDLPAIPKESFREWWNKNRK